MNPKVLIVASGNSKYGISSIIAKQAESLKQENVVISFFHIKGHGIKGYLKNIFHLNKFVKSQNFDILHAHYSFSGFVATLAFTRKPVVVSLMGTDVNKNAFMSLLNRLFAQIGWNAVIVKSQDMYQKLNYKAAHVIPNGVDLNAFYSEEKNKAREKIGLQIKTDERMVLFGASTSRREKNFSLAKTALEKIENIKVLFLTNVLHKDVVNYLNAADVLLLTSKYEGSPNIIKEAMACNCPIVSTNVGDVNWVLGDTDGCYITNFSPIDVSEKINKALHFSETKGKTKGRERIIQLGLNSELIANKIKSIYEDILDYYES